MMIGSAGGSDVPWSFSFMSFIAIENSNLSIFPSLFISARALGDKETESHQQALSYCSSTIVKNFHCSKVCECVSVCACVCLCFHHISANTEAGSPDWRKNFLACSPTERNRKRRNRETQEKIEIGISKGCVVMLKLRNQCAGRKITVGMMCWQYVRLCVC